MPKPSQQAAKATAWELERIAASETASAFNAEHERQAERHARAAPLLLKYWDATLDRRTCPTCSSLSGQTRPWGVPFEGGAVPGAVHANCRCREGTIAAPVFWEAS